MKKTIYFLAGLIVGISLVSAPVMAYTVQSGDTLWKIANNANLSFTELVKMNPQVENPDLIYVGDEINTSQAYNLDLPYFKNLSGVNEGLLGGNDINFVQVQNLYLSGSGISATKNTIGLTSFKYPVNELNVVMSDFGDIGYAVIEPDTNREENISFTGITQNANGTATLTGVSRGLGLSYPYTASTTLASAHAGGTILRISNTAPFYNEFNIKGKDETITGNWTFSKGITISSTTDESWLKLGDGTSSYNKTLYANNGDATLPFLRYNEASNVWQWSLNGTDTYDFTNTAFTVLTASSTRGIGITDSKIHLNASTTNGFAFDDNGFSYLKASTTKGLAYDSNGWYVDGTDIFNFTGDNTFSGENTFSATSTMATTTITNLCVSGECFKNLYTNIATSTELNYSHTGDTIEQTIFSYSIPANSLGTKGSINVYFTGKMKVANANNYVYFKVKYDNEDICKFETIHDGWNNDKYIEMKCSTANKSVSSQLGLSQFAAKINDASSDALFLVASSTSVNSSLDKNLTITGKSTGGTGDANTFNINNIRLEVKEFD